MRIFLEGEDSYGDYGLGRLVEIRFKAPQKGTPIISLFSAKSFEVACGLLENLCTHYLMMSGEIIALDIKHYSKETRTLHVRMILCRCYHLPLFCISTGIPPPLQINVTQQGK